SEKITIKGLDNRLNPRQKVQMVIERAKGRKTKVTLLSRIDTQNEMEYFRSGGILQYVLRQLAA
ncbi:MAG: hypothetical protein VYE79_01350, partial [Pseudomonadota bacterium]|nr:hypothetical protein [Pseudomonadota bacterium]